jgi:hypothetical protein
VVNGNTRVWNAAGPLRKGEVSGIFTHDVTALDRSGGSDNGRAKRRASERNSISHRQSRLARQPARYPI